MKLTKPVLAAAVALAAPAWADTPGVTDTEIRIGSAQDLSGLFAAFPVPAVNAANMVFDQVNAEDVIAGTKISMSETDHVPAQEIFISAVDNRGWQLLETITH